jgi:hypothetical protein
MKKLLGVISAAVMATSLTTLNAAPHADATSAGVQQRGAGITGAALTMAPHRQKFQMSDTYAREVTRYGQSDSSVHSIAHVRELQYRLRWEGVFRAGVTGTFGDLTQAAVLRYQRHEGLRRTGVASHITWAHLLHDTLRHPGQIPRSCKRDGWHACYDRSMHQVTLWRNGEIRNAWLVRGGGSNTPTRLGNSRVYYRDKDHTSRTFGGSPMPYSQFFDGGEAYHGSGFMMDPFVDHSHGCINMYIEDARQLWNMTYNKPLFVTVYGAWD